VNATIEVRRYGRVGPAVTVLHGGPGAPGSAGALAAALADTFRVAEPLQRRAGGTPLTVAGHVADLAGVVDEPAHVVGWSWGAMLGLSFTAAHPDAVRSLVLVGCGTYDEASRALYRDRMDARLGRSGRKLMDQVRDELIHAANPAERDYLLAVRGSIAGRAMAYAPIEDEGLQPHADAQGHEETWNDVLRLQAEGVEPAAFAVITCPVLMLHGDTDPHPGHATRDVLRQYVPQLEYVELERCGHTPWLETHAREPFFDTLHTWLTTH
jgi:pimeloyl-ACP methyl ester carboxylesterase